MFHLTGWLYGDFHPGLKFQFGISSWKKCPFEMSLWNPYLYLTTFYFFVKKFIFSNVLFQWIRYSNVFICFCLRKEPSIKYVCNWWGMGRSSKMGTAAYSGRGFQTSSGRPQLYFLTQSLFVFLVAFLSWNDLFYL